LPNSSTIRGAPVAALALLCVTLLLAAPARAEPSFKFASASEGRALLSARDEFIEQMGPFDRAFRMRADGEVSESEYLSVIAQSVLEWQSEEKRTVECALEQLGPALSRLYPPLEAPIHLVKTTGRGELAPYTRGNAIVLPVTALASSQGRLRWILAHEFFHVFSRNNPKLRNALYEAIGFRHCGKVEVPAALRSRMLTNPDAPKSEHCIRVTFSGKEVWAVPITHAPRYDKASRQELIWLLDLTLLLVEKDGVSGIARPILNAGEPSWVSVEQVSGFFEQIGRNTSYIIHPEEILADNATLLTLGQRNVPSPEILSRIAALLGGDPTPGQNAPKTDCSKP
jgi:hypothetical protein